MISKISQNSFKVKSSVRAEKCRFLKMQQIGYENHVLLLNPSWFLCFSNLLLQGGAGLPTLDVRRVECRHWDRCHLCSVPTQRPAGVTSHVSGQRLQGAQRKPMLPLPLPLECLTTTECCRRFSTNHSHSLFASESCLWNQMTSHCGFKDP